jgi:hypothetical protein
MVDLSLTSLDISRAPASAIPRPVSCPPAPQYGLGRRRHRRPREKRMPDRPPDQGLAFPSTRWSRILAHESASDLEALAQSYWRPIHAWLRARLRLDDDGASDLVQDAFAWMLSTRFLARASPSRGSFRGLLKTALARFAIERWRHETAEKRGGGQAHEPIGDEHDRADPRSPTPDQVLDQEWRRELLERARAQLETELVTAGKETHWLLFRDWFLDEGDGEAADYRALAARHGITRTDVSNWLDHAKRRYREILRALVVETVRDEDELQAELRWLFGPVEGKRP